MGGLAGSLFESFFVYCFKAEASGRFLCFTEKCRHSANDPIADRKSEFEQIELLPLQDRFKKQTITLGYVDRQTLNS